MIPRSPEPSSSRSQDTTDHRADVQPFASHSGVREISVLLKGRSSSIFALSFAANISKHCKAVHCNLLTNLQKVRVEQRVDHGDVWTRHLRAALRCTSQQPAVHASSLHVHLCIHGIASRALFYCISGLPCQKVSIKPTLSAWPTPLPDGAR